MMSTIVRSAGLTINTRLPSVAYSYGLTIGICLVTSEGSEWRETEGGTTP